MSEQLRPSDTTANPGATLRRIRTQRGWTLAEVARRSGLPVSTLSKVENARMALTYDKLTRISEALEIDIAALFVANATEPNSRSPTGGRRSITRAGEGQAVETEQYLHLYPASELLNKHFVPIIAQVKARTLEEFGELIRHPGEEYAYVVEGSILLHTDLYAPLLMNKGDSIYFDSSMGHAYLAGAPGPCVVLSICSPQSGAPAVEPAESEATPSPRHQASRRRKRPTDA